MVFEMQIIWEAFKANSRLGTWTPTPNMLTSGGGIIAYLLMDTILTETGQRYNFGQGVASQRGSR